MTTAGVMLFRFDPIQWEPVPNRKARRRMAADCRVWLNGQLLTTIRKGFDSDGMSFPWGVRLTWDDPWHDRYAFGAWLHDWLLDLLAREMTSLKKWQIDWLAEGCWRSFGVSALETWIFTNAVRTRR